MTSPLLSLFLVVGLMAVPLIPQASGEEKIAITYGSVLKLMHGTTKSRLHCSNARYQVGGHHQVVTGNKGVSDSNSYWVVKPAVGLFKQGDLIPNGSTIRLQHMQTQNWLHVRSHPSPLSGNLEVSCCEEEDANNGDVWRLESIDESEVWMKDQKVRLKHVDTGSFLHSHDMKYLRVLRGQMEVCGVMEGSTENVWLATEGLYLYGESSLRQDTIEMPE